MNYLIAFTAFVAFYALVTLWSARRAAIETERKDFFVCEKHGPVPMQGGTVSFSAADSGLGQPVVQCVLCFNEAFKTAEKAAINSTGLVV